MDQPKIPENKSVIQKLSEAVNSLYKDVTGQDQPTDDLLEKILGYFNTERSTLKIWQKHSEVQIKDLVHNMLLIEFYNPEQSLMMGTEIMKIFFLN